MNEFLELLRKAIDEGRTVTITADEIVIKANEMTMSCPNITIE